MGATHRELIIQAAQKRFHQYGYSKVTMEEIAADIQTSKSALYYHFADKNAIFREVLSLEQRAFQDQTQQLISNERCGSKRLKGYFAIILQMLCRFQNLGVFDPSEARPALHGLFADFIKEQKNQLLEILDSPDFIMERKSEIAELIIHLVQGLRIRQKVKEVSYEQFAADIELLAEVLLNGIQRR